jgi:uncharacterized integral membrane protein (TIGR00698 family)
VRAKQAASVVFVLLAVACLLPWAPPWAALIAGMALALTLGNPFAAQSKSWSKILLQVSVVLLGFSMDLGKVIAAGRDGILFAFLSITAVFLLGWATQRLLRIRPVTGLLVSTGTAICGGSAIAAMSSVVDAPQEDVSVSVGTIFLLNAVALIVFPPLGHTLGLTQHQFGVWSGIAIHDVASVVGAGKQYGAEALDVATAVKLSRVLYLIPITLIAAAWIYRGRKADDQGAKVKPQIPWFIGGFLLASVARTYLPDVATSAPTIKMVATAGLALALFLIGTGISKATLKAVGVRPLLQGVLLWAFISVAALLLVKGVIG